MRLLSDSTTVASFQFGAKVDPSHLYAPVRVPVTSSGTCHGVVIWWDMELGDRTLSMDPWDYPQWRDHWLQAVQLWPQPVKLTEGEVEITPLTSTSPAIAGKASGASLQGMYPLSLGERLSSSRR